MEKILFVVQRYGEEIVGGSESHCRQLAERLTEFYDVDVLTTTSYDVCTWDSFYQEGVSSINKVNIIRFPVHQPRQAGVDEKIKQIRNNADTTFEEEVQILKEIGPNSPELIDYIRKNASRYYAVIFVCYYFMTFSIGALGVKNAILIPTLHDEDLAYLKYYKHLFSNQNNMLLNSEEELKTIKKIYGITEGNDIKIAGLGIDLPDSNYDRPHVVNGVEIPENYVIYVGRCSESKGCLNLIRFFEQIKNSLDEDVQLLFVGSVELDVSESSYIKFLGFVSDDQKNALIKYAKALINPSQYESLSLVCLESLALGTPIIVNGFCPVTVRHAMKSNNGYSYKTSSDLLKCINSVLRTTKTTNRINGISYVHDNYSWGVVLTKVREVIEKVGHFTASDRAKVSNSMDDICTTRLLDWAVGKKIIVISSSDFYVRYLSVTLASLALYHGKQDNIGIVVLSDGIVDSNRNLIRTQCDQSGFSVFFIECSHDLNNFMKEEGSSRYSRATYLRLLIPKYFSGVDRALYLDADIVINGKLDYLFEVDLGENYVAAVPDAHIKVVRRFRERTMKYLSEIGMRESEPYFNAGVLVLNLKQILKKFSTDELFNLVRSRDWYWCDQDVLNILFRNRVTWLDTSWNFIWLNDPPIQTIMEADENYFSAKRSPKILHYAGGTMPVTQDTPYGATEFWRAARHSFMYEDLFANYLCRKYIENNRFVRNSQDGPSGYIKFKKTLIYYISATLRYYSQYGLIMTVRKIVSFLKSRL